MGDGARQVKLLVKEFRVRIKIPDKHEQSDIIEIQGLRDNCEHAKEAILSRFGDSICTCTVQVGIHQNHPLILIRWNGVMISKLILSRSAFFRTTFLF